LFNANSAIFQLYHDENKLIFNKMMMGCKQLNKNTHDTCMTHVRVVCIIFDI